MDVPERGADAQGPILVVMWRGHRVQVFADGPLRRTTQTTRHVMGFIATSITEADTVDGIIDALRASTLGETYDVEGRVEEGVLRLWLRERPPRAVAAT